MRAAPAIWIILVGLLAWAFGADAAFADKRVALVIGNSAYVRTTRLNNPENDASDVAAVLRNLSFEVILKTNVDRNGLDHALEEFERKSKGSDTSLFYFAGHGLQLNGRNYLLPIDADLEDEVSVRYNTLALDRVREALDAAGGVKILILDACRNNPLSEKLASRPGSLSRSVGLTRGLARLDRTEGLVVAYATAPDQVAQDGAGRNSPFAEALIKRLAEPGLEIGTLFRRIAQDVFERTNGRQRPEISISLLNDYFLNTRETDSMAWARIRGSSDQAAFEQFIRDYPNSGFRRDAQVRIDLFARVRRENEERIARARDSEAAERDRLRREVLERERLQLEAQRRALEKAQEEMRLAAEAEGRRVAAREESARQEEQRRQQIAQQREADRREVEQLAAQRNAGRLAAVAPPEAQADKTREPTEEQLQAQERQERARLVIARRLAVGAEAERLDAAIRELDRRAVERLAAQRRRDAARRAAEEEALRQRAGDSSGPVGESGGVRTR